MSQSELKAIKCSRRQARETARVSESRLVLVLLLIGWKSGASFTGQSQSEAVQNQSKRNHHSTPKWKPLYINAAKCRADNF